MGIGRVYYGRRCSSCPIDDPFVSFARQLSTRTVSGSCAIAQSGRTVYQPSHADRFTRDLIANAMLTAMYYPDTQKTDAESLRERILGGISRLFTQVRRCRNQVRRWSSLNDSSAL